MRKIRRRPKLTTDINITPFTDVILVLLIIFMIAAPLIARKGIEVALPQVSHGQSFDKNRQMEITITAEGIIYLDREVVTQEELRSSVRHLLDVNKNLKVIVSADQSCRFQEIVHVMDVLKDLGVRNLNISTRNNQ